jgi:ribosomal protein S18 acetylase RimI-like enzyme
MTDRNRQKSLASVVPGGDEARRYAIKPLTKATRNAIERASLHAHGFILQDFGMEVRRVRAEQWRELRDTRLLALSESPDAFETQYEEAVQRSEDWWIDWAARSAEGNRQAFFLAWDGEAPLGILGAYVDEGRCWLISMWTVPSVRRQGIGAALLQAAVAFAREGRHTDLFLRVRVENAPARRLYKRSGFLETSQDGDEREMRRPL